MKKLLLFVISLSFVFPCFSETIKLKSGKILEAKILEKTDRYIKVDIEGIPITYYLDDIASIDGLTTSKGREETPPPQANTVNLSSNGIDTEHIHTLLKHLGYPENTWPAIEKELVAFLTKINFPRLKQEAAKAKSNPEQLKQFVSKLGRLIEQEGCLNIQSTHPLIKLLVISLSTEDVFQAIETSTLSQQEKDKSRHDLIACSAISQLGSILLKSLDINVKAVLAPRHVFNCISLDDKRVLFIDFTNQVFEIVDINQYYKPEGRYYTLKEEYRFTPERAREIFEQWLRGAQLNTLKEIFNCLYFYIYLANDYTVTSVIYSNLGEAYADQGNFLQAISDYSTAIEINPNDAAVYSNRGIVYEKQGNFSQAISDYNKAIEIYSDYALAYSNRGVAYNDQGNFPQAISDYNKAIEINPIYAEAYSNRGVAYNNQGNLFQALSDFTKAIEINPNSAEAYGGRGTVYVEQGNFSQAISDFTEAIEINPNFAQAYYNRGFTYYKQGNLSQAISDYTKAIKINPNYVEAYNNRGVAYFVQKDFAKAWEDVHKAERLGVKVNSQFLEELKKASGREK